MASRFDDLRVVSKKSPRVCVIGPFPPPRHGVSAINEKMADLLEREGVSVVAGNTSMGTLNRSLFIRLGRAAKIVRVLGTLLRAGRGSPVAGIYMSLSGGAGLFYESIIACAARRACARLVVHHNSYRYIDVRRTEMRLLAAAAGREAIHVAVDPGMAHTLSQLYGCVRLTVISNVAFLPDADHAKEAKNGQFTVGYLCNISFEKGIADVMALARLARKFSSDVAFLVAGPFEDKKVEHFFRETMATLSNVRYLGPVYGDEKARFWQSIDVFIFPTRYKNEAEPLVVLEAMSYGCPVIANARGSIPSMLGQSAGFTVGSEENFSNRAWAIIDQWRQNRRTLDAMHPKIKLRFDNMRLQALEVRNNLIKYLTGMTPWTFINLNPRADPDAHQPNR
jgi:glycosyltransferase involved in cell wall biosynthesis